MQSRITFLKLFFRLTKQLKSELGHIGMQKADRPLWQAVNLGQTRERAF